jgi:hypothetical protein
MIRKSPSKSNLSSENFHHICTGIPLSTQQTNLRVMSQNETVYFQVKQGRDCLEKNKEAIGTMHLLAPKYMQQQS